MLRHRVGNGARPGGSSDSGERIPVPVAEVDMKIIRRSMLVAGLCLALASGRAAAADVAPISAAELEGRLVRRGEPLVVLDVRTAEEFAAGHVPGARNIPVAELGSRMSELAPLKDVEMVVYCRSGRRAGLALETLGSQGFRRLRHLDGDMIGWDSGGHRLEAGAGAAAVAR